MATETGDCNQRRRGVVDTGQDGHVSSLCTSLERRPQARRFSPDGTNGVQCRRRLALHQCLDAVGLPLHDPVGKRNIADRDAGPSRDIGGVLFEQPGKLILHLLLGVLQRLFKTIVRRNVEGRTQMRALFRIFEKLQRTGQVPGLQTFTHSRNQQPLFKIPTKLGCLFLHAREDTSRLVEARQNLIHGLFEFPGANVGLCLHQGVCGLGVRRLQCSVFACLVTSILRGFGSGGAEAEGRCHA